MNYQEQMEHYKAVRSRLINGAPRAAIVQEAQAQSIPVAFAERDPRREILRDCANEYGCSVADLMGHSRRSEIVHARRKAMYLIYSRGKMSKAGVGRFMNKDHTTVMHALKKYEAENGGSNG
jgi:chromosomal replication initiation ATPase DnaA